jgi:hypothetical protein
MKVDDKPYRTIRLNDDGRCQGSQSVCSTEDRLDRKVGRNREAAGFATAERPAGGCRASPIIAAADTAACA